MSSLRLFNAYFSHPCACKHDTVLAKSFLYGKHAVTTTSVREAVSNVTTGHTI